MTTSGGAIIDLFGSCSIEDCEAKAVRLVRVNVEPASDDPGVRAMADRLNRLGVPMCDPCGHRWAP